MSIAKTAFRQALRDGDFTGLFVESGWDKPPAGATVQPIEIAVLGEGERRSFVFREAARKCGVRVWTCVCAELPEAAVCRALDVKLRKFSDFYLAVFVKQGEALRHLWVVPVKNVDKRVLVKARYDREEQTDFLHSRIASIAFPLDAEVELVDVLDKIGAAFRLNATEITRRFYREFKQQHSLFVQGIRNILLDNERVWYASIMLNRLMFCYFIQKKGFLNNDPEYLVHKLKEVQEKQGENKFYGSFYKTFLRALFQEGLNRPDHDSPEFRAVFGRIPYLNGGMFEQHAIERNNPDLDIPDSVFERLFAFFDEWRWHLDTRITATGRDINPDVLGYIFEQYINDRAQMGAYYTKEDITEYIGRSTIVPFLLDAVAKKSPRAFAKNGFVWKTMRESGDRYIFPAVRKGVDLPLPDHIQQGVDADRPGLLERRARWNEKTDAALALPTEIWRETVARRLRCVELRRKIASGEILAVNDLITCNLDIRAFAEDLLKTTDDHLFIRHFYEALRSVTILDPTCGSGAFLFAALNILEPLYEICIQRMQDDFSGAFKDELAELKEGYKGNLQYFIYKNIILRNLYGVDIMREATEIARLRLFLKMVAVVDVNRKDPNLGLEPLPDIDFNVRCGNTLVGYASEEEIDAGLQSNEILTYQLNQKIKDELNKVRLAAKQFRDAQLLDDKPDELRVAKQELGIRLEKIRRLWDNQLYQSNGSGKTFENWHADTLPFHWYAEFYEIMSEHGGFDVIIGNPPYVEYNRKHKGSNKSTSDYYKLFSYITIRCGNLYTYTLERCFSIIHSNSKIGMIVPLSLTCGERMGSIRNFINLQNGFQMYANFEIFPSRLFEGAYQRTTIFQFHSSLSHYQYVTKLHRWYASERDDLINNIQYITSCSCKHSDGIPKLSGILHKKCIQSVDTGNFVSFCTQSNDIIFYQEATNYWMKNCMRIPYYKKNEEISIPDHGRVLFFHDMETKKSVFSNINSSLFYIWFITFSDGFHLSDDLVKKYPYIQSKELCNIAQILEEDIQRNSFITTRNTKNDSIEIESFRVNKSKSIIDKIDIILSKYYQFTEEELDFIINYDIKYRMGDELAE